MVHALRPGEPRRWSAPGPYSGLHDPPVPTSTLVNLALVCHVHSRAVLALSPVMLLGALGDGSVLGRVAPEAKVEHIITNKNGRIAERNTYGHGPHEIPGQRWLLKTEMTTRAT
jgi:hypothetical protein